MSTKADRTMFNSTARRLPLEQHADTPTNSQSKVGRLCEMAGTAEFDGAKPMTEIVGGDSNRVPKGKACSEDYD